MKYEKMFKNVAPNIEKAVLTAICDKVYKNSIAMNLTRSEKVVSRSIRDAIREIQEQENLGEIPYLDFMVSSDGIDPKDVPHISPMKVLQKIRYSQEARQFYNAAEYFIEDCFRDVAFDIAEAIMVMTRQHEQADPAQDAA